jgi:hypothetical protein
VNIEEKSDIFPMRREKVERMCEKDQQRLVEIKTCKESNEESERKPEVGGRGGGVKADKKWPEREKQNIKLSLRRITREL